MSCKRDILCVDKFYHIYNHAVASENLFITKDDYILFLRKYEKIASPYFNVYSYCLMPNHFHFLIKVKSIEELDILGLKKSDNIHNFLSQKLGNFFNSYTKSYNIIHNRKGGLFIDSFKRISIDSEMYLRKLIIYIHNNPVNHGFVQKPENWIYSSFKNIFYNSKKKIEYISVIDWFGDKENYLFCHRIETDLADEFKLEI